MLTIEKVYLILDCLACGQGVHKLVNCGEHEGKYKCLSCRMVRGL